LPEPSSTAGRALRTAWIGSRLQRNCSAGIGSGGRRNGRLPPVDGAPLNRDSEHLPKMSRASDRDPVVDQAVLLRGYQQAVARFDESRLGHDATVAFLPLFEALNWAASIDERLRYPDYPELRGLRFARNRVHHQWAEALYVDVGAPFR
jgi:hypothetical protein